MKNKIFRQIGESLAAEYLKRQKYKILEQNFTNNIGEIDIIARKSNYIVFVEVKIGLQRNLDCQESL